MAMSVGSRVWLPCEVKEGPFADERLVRVPSERQDVVGFVPTSALREAVASGRTFVKAVVIDVRGSTFLARLPGHFFSSEPFRGSTSAAEPCLAV